MDQVFEMRKAHTYILKTSQPIKKETAVRGLNFKGIDNNTYEITISDEISVTDIIEKLKLSNINVVSMGSKRNMLEELFMELTKEKTEL